MEQIKSPLKLNRIDFWLMWLCCSVSLLAHYCWLRECVGNRHGIKPEQNRIQHSMNGKSNWRWLLFNTKLRGAMQIINVSIMMFIVIHCALLVFSNRFGVNLYRAQSISDALYITDMRSVLSPHAFQFTSSSYLSTLEFIRQTPRTNSATQKSYLLFVWRI